MSDDRFARSVLLVSVLFAAGIAAGIIAIRADPGIGETLVEILRTTIIGEIAGDNPFVVFAKILANNLQACLLLFLGGASLGILTVFIITSNGLIIGAVIEIVRQKQGLLYIIAGVLPHGIFEIPSFILSGTLGFLLAGALMREWYGSGDAAPEAMKLGKLFFRYVIPLVGIAAFVEAFITPEIIRLVL